MSDMKFLSFILNEGDHSQKLWIEAYISLQRNPAQASTFLANREISGGFIAGFEVYGMRIAKFLQQVPRYTPKATPGGKAKEELDSKQALGGHVIKGVLIPLLGNEYRHLHTRDALFELLVSAIPLSDRNCFDQLAARLSEIPELLGKMISEQRSTNHIQEWINFLPTNQKSMQNWTEAVVDLAKNCDSDHGVSQKTERWDLLKALRISLHKAKHQVEGSNQSFKPNPLINSQASFRVLKDGEGYSGGTRRTSVSSATINLSSETLMLLRNLGIDAPHSERTLLRTIEVIESTETFNILEPVISTFPCRLCFTRGYGKGSSAVVPVIQTNFEQRLDELDLDSFEGLLGSDLGIWKISLSAQALKDLKHSKREGNFPHIKEKLMALASGEWGRKSLTKTASDDTGRFKVRVFQAWYGSNGRILWQVDVGFDEKHNADCQIVRVWRIGDVKEMLSSLDSVYRTQKTFSVTRVDRCKKHVVDKSQNKKIPAVFRDSEEDGVNESPKTTDERTPQDMLISGKFHTLTSTVLDSILNGQSRSDFPFDVTGKEVEIIKHFRTATFVLGRSGTGKTSCLLYKLLSRYLARNLVEETPIRQYLSFSLTIEMEFDKLLLTRSEPLARKLESEVQLLIDTQLLRVKAGFNYADEDNDTPPHIRDGMDEDTTEDLFSLRKQDFPLVCTFGHFLKRLENTIKANDRKDFLINTGAGRDSTNMRQMVDFSIFRAAYWQQFPTSVKGNLEPDLVFTEIMGVIKGAASLLTGLKSLSREEYRAKSSRLAPTFAKESDRDAVYNVFEYYENKKKQNGDYDGIDRVKSILEELKGNIVLKRRVEALFEEKMELISPRGTGSAAIRNRVAPQPSSEPPGYPFWFANVKALFYDHFSGSSFAKMDPALAKPELFSLSRNFRSHQGILSLASFVMDLLWKGFPDMVDKLPPEIGQYLGPKPVIFVGSNIVELLKMAGESAGNSERKDGGTQSKKDDVDTTQVKNRQVVIIRDHDIQEGLQNKLGDGSLVFTVLQSKGMEYDDVFLFDFFSSSPCLKSYKSLQELLHSGPNPNYGINHMNMCSELKNLYVAITRPRSRLWILESNTSFMLELFTERVPEPLVKIKYFTSEDLPGLMPEVRPASATSAREWIETGEQCMERGLFDQALRCFKNAQDTQKVLWAEASVAEQKGRECRAKGDVEGLKSYFREATNYFLEIEMKERAAHCLEAMGDFAAAAGYYAEKRRHEKAAGLFEKAGMHERAADQYHKAGITFKALQALYNGKLFDLLVHSVHKYRDSIEDGDRKTYARECNILLRQQKISQDLWDMTFDTFNSDSEKEEFLKEFQHKKELLEFYLTRGRITDAFKYSVKQGDFDRALELIIDQGSKHGVDLEESEDDLQLKQVFKYSQTKKLFSNISKPSAASGVDLSCDRRFSGSSWGSAWEELVTVANQYFKSGIKPDRSSIKQDWIKEYMDTIISMKVEFFIKPGADMNDLPVEYICGLARATKSISQSKGLPIPQSILLCLGVLLIPGEPNPYVVLPWSSLPMDPKSSRTLDYESVVKKVVECLKRQVQNASTVIEKKARALWENFAKLARCDACAIRVRWDEPEKVGGRGPKCSHDILSEVQFSKSIQCLTRLCRSFDDLEMPLDYWLTALLSQMRHDSSLFQDAGVITATNKSVFTSAASKNIAQKLRERFTSTWEPWRFKNTRLDFVSLLENYQLGCNLGSKDILGVEQRTLNSALERRFFVSQKPTGQRGRAQDPPPDFAAIAFNNYQFLRSQVQKSPSQFSAGRFVRITIADGTDIIIPKSWMKLYLPNWERFFKTTTDLEQCCYQQTLLRVVADFCDLINELESSPQQGRLGEKELLARRSIDLIVVALTNIGTIGPLPLRYGDIWAKIQRVFGNKGLGASNIQGVAANALVEPLVRAFQLYNGKDSILLYVREGKLSKRAESLNGTGIRLALLPIRRSFLGHLPAPEDGPLNASFLIQAWYRRKRANRIRDKKHLASPTGRAVSFMFSFCDIQGSEMSAQQSWEFLAVMVDEGLELYLLLNMILEKSKKIRSFSARMHITDEVKTEFLGCEKQLFTSLELFSTDRPSAFALKQGECRERCRKELELVKALGEQMEAILQKLQNPPEPPKRGGKGGQKVDQRGPNDTPKGGQKGGPKDKQKSETNDPPKDVPKDEPMDEPKGGTKGGSNDASKELSKNTPGDLPQNAPKSKKKGKGKNAQKTASKDEGPKASEPEESNQGENNPKGQESEVEGGKGEVEGDKGEVEGDKAVAEEDKAEVEEDKKGKGVQESEVVENEWDVKAPSDKLGQDQKEKGKDFDAVEPVEGESSAPALEEEEEEKKEEQTGGPQKGKGVSTAGNYGAASQKNKGKNKGGAKNKNKKGSRKKR